MKSKKWAIVRLSAVLVALAFVLIVRIYWPNNTFLKILCLSVLAITAGAHLIAMCCPHCGSVGRLPCHLFSKTCGRCRKCGELIYWKECLEVDI